MSELDDFIKKLNWRKDRLDDNQNYELIRRCIIAFFAKDPEKLRDFGYEIGDFQPCMKFIKSIYFEYCKNKEI